MSKTRLLALSLPLALGCQSAADDAPLSASGKADSPSQSDSGDEGHGGHQGHCEAAPVMLSGDFDGSGTVDPADIDRLEAMIDLDDYAAFYDMNADGELTGLDVAMVAKNLYEPSHARDQEIALAFADTERFRDLQTAIAAEFGPFTADYVGHGTHWANLKRIGRWQVAPGFDPGQPEGLNYSPTGELLAAFYYSPGAFDLFKADPSIPERTTVMPMPVTGGFTGDDDMWHQHIGACFNGLGTPQPDFEQCVIGTECTADLWSSRFHMLHLWMYAYNPCGPFAGTNPLVSPDGTPEPHAMDCELEDVVTTVIPYDPSLLQ